jgi:hypothetical protein
MSYLIDKFLVKIGVKGGYESLTSEERVVFDRWETELAGAPVTVEDIKKFLETQQAMNLSEFENFENKHEKDLYLKVYSRICRQLISFIETPEKTRKMREESLKDKLK